MPYWRTGGTIHVIINNQIGFTTMPKQGRFTPYPTDIAKSDPGPDLPRERRRSRGRASMRPSWRSRSASSSKCDVMIDLWCYRRHGHNETDEPAFTQPVMYREIAAAPDRPRALRQASSIAERQDHAGEVRAR